ncbi:probable G-protein coupled receptor 139 [Callorhinchus milii]|uniref:probable G-protein coupled receptor 139 n=1 Tax=Callorhinchus milii TaxID=7868 RepID=UPI001C3F7C56|nr:probable G-protein coupled receptor 139 [Callorhinchus milii]
MTTADLLVLIFHVVIYFIFRYYFYTSFLEYTPVCRLSEATNYILVDCSVWLTVAFTVDRSVAICYPKLKAQYCTLRTAQLITAALCGLSCLKNIAVYFKFEPYYVIDKVPRGCSTKPTYYTYPGWHVLAANRKRRALLGHSRKEGSSDPELQSRRRSIILLFAISGSFVLLWMPYVVFFLYCRSTNSDYEQHPFTHPLQIASFTVDMFQLLSSGTNTCIYALAQTRFREELINAVKYPFKWIMNLFRK